MSSNDEQKYNNDVSNEDDVNIDRKSKRRALRDSKSKDAKKRTKKSKNKKSEIIYPDLVVFGFQEGTSLSDLKTYLKSKAEELGSLDLSHFNIIKKNGGFYWEIHDSGSGKGVLSSVLAILEEEHEVVVKTSRRWVRVLKNRNGDGISSFLLNEDSEGKETEGVSYSDKMKSFSRKGNGFLYFSTVIALMGIISVFSTYIIKYELLKPVKEIDNSKSKVEVPYSKYDEMKSVLNSKDKGSFIKSIKLSGNQYIIEMGKEEIIEPVAEVIDEEDSNSEELIDISDLESLLEEK